RRGPRHADIRELRRVRRAAALANAVPLPAAGAVASQGVGITGADRWQDFASEAFGLARGTPVRVAILDLGFGGYADLMASGELPADTAAHDFAPDWDIEGCLDNDPNPCDPPVNGIVDGAAVAEIVADMAPSAHLELLAVDSGVLDSLTQAVDYILTGGPGNGPAADLVISTLTWSPGAWGDGFGTGPVDDEVARVLAAGIPWINDVGDTDFLALLLLAPLFTSPPAAADHWHGTFDDSFDSDGYMDVWFADDDPAAGGWLNEFCLGQDDRIYFDLVWDDWVDPEGNSLPNSDQDYSLDIYELTADGTLQLVDTSANQPQTNLQAGRDGDFPWDLLDFGNPGPGQACYFLAIFRENQSAGSNRFHLYWEADNDFNPGTVSTDFVPPRSLTPGNRMIPADLPGVVAVGVTDLADALEPFSAWGLETEEVPFLCAPARDIQTVTFGGGFQTSFGAAHVGGAAALLMDRVGFLDGAAALAVLGGRARDVLGTAPDYRCGHGRLCTLTNGCPLP
ncbi:MAG: hypothetical protein D6718_06570, partial [Acidobacteria bacterium]